MTNAPRPTDANQTQPQPSNVAQSEPLPEVSVEMQGSMVQVRIGEGYDHERQRLMKAMGITSRPFLEAVLHQIANAVSPGGVVSETTIRFAVGVVVALKPKDEIEAMLAAQMAAVHICAMDSSRRYLNAGSLASRDSAERAMTKLTRTFAVQMETLKRYRSKGQQVVRVERVTVHEGGQAIVGAVSHGGEGWR